MTIPFIILKIWKYTHKLTKTYGGRTDVQIDGQWERIASIDSYMFQCFLNDVLCFDCS